VLNVKFTVNGPLVVVSGGVTVNDVSIPEAAELLPAAVAKAGSPYPKALPCVAITPKHPDVAPTGSVPPCAVVAVNAPIV